MECRIETIPVSSIFERRRTLPKLSIKIRPPFSQNVCDQNGDQGHCSTNHEFSNDSSSITSLNSSFDLPERLQPLFPSVNPNDAVLPVECGINEGLLYLSRLCQGSKGHCILYHGSWLTPNEFQLVSGRVTAKDWKRSIRHNGKSLKLLISKGALSVHSPLCDCGSHQEAPQGMELLDHLQYNNANGLNNHHHKLLTTTQQSSKNQRMTSCGNGGIKRETRLTSIIDSLLVSRTHEGSQSCSSSESEFGFEVPQTPASGKIAENFKGLSPSQERKGRNGEREVGESLHNALNNPASTESGEEEPPPQQLNANINQNSALSSTTSTASTSVAPPTTTKSRTSKKQKAPPIKSERQSPESVRSSPSPSKPPSNGGGSRGPSPPLRQMELMMGRNCSDYMRSLAAKYQHANPNDLYTSGRLPLNFDSRFIKPAAAAASLLAFQQQHADKLQFPLIDMSSTQTLLSMVRSAAASSAPSNSSTPPTPNALNANPQQMGSKRASSPLDLSSAAALVGLSAASPPKKSKSQPGGSGGSGSRRCGSNCSGCSSEGEGIVSGWTVDDVCRFVGSIDLCAEYIQAFRDHSIDGSSLPLLTEDHLMQNMSMKLGPALKFKSTVAKKLGNCPVCRHCTHCHVPTDSK